jgi:ethanolamine utilization protein EutN
MYLGRVKGTVVAERIAAGLEGQKLLLVQPVDDRMKPTGGLQVAVDTTQAGPDDLVFLVGSREAALACDPFFVPVDAAIVGIVDQVYAPEREPKPAAPAPAAASPARKPAATPPGKSAATPPGKKPAATPPATPKPPTRGGTRG